MRKNIRLVLAIFTLLVSLAIFLFAIDVQLPAIVKFIIALAALASCGLVLSKLYRLETWAGLFLLRSKAGLGMLDKLAKKHKKLWKYFADIGLVVGFGSFAYFLMGKKKFSWKKVLLTYGTGTVLLVLLTSIVMPLAITSLLSMLSGGEEFSGAGSKISQEIYKFEAAQYAYLAFLVLGGISLLTTASIVLYGAIVLWAIVGALLGDFASLASTSPGGAPIIPGINLPLIEGIAALAVILIVHEGMHGVLARLHKLPLKSAGLVFLGFIPIGAFVDINEKVLFKAKKEKQNSVFVAGTAANFATSVIFLILLLAFAYLFQGNASEPVLFFMRFLALAFSLNFIVGAINLVPLPLFDGYHLVKNGLNNKTLTTLVSYIVGLAFLLNLFPWVLR